MPSLWMRSTYLVLALSLWAVPVLSYEGVLPEPANDPNYGNGTLICPGIAGMSATCFMHMGTPVDVTNQSRMIGQCVYCHTLDPMADCAAQIISADLLIAMFPERSWLTNTAGPCGFGQACDTSSTIIQIDGPIGTGNTAGCDAGPIADACPAVGLSTLKRTPRGHE